MTKFSATLLASVILVDTACPTSQIDRFTVSKIADAIFRSENSRNHPYGVMIPTDNPRKVCINTVNHAWVDFEREHNGQLNVSLKTQNVVAPAVETDVSLPFIQFLGSRYCPPSVDAKGYRNWTNNVWRIYKKSL